MGKGDEKDGNLHRRIPKSCSSRWLAKVGRGIGHRYLRLNVGDENESHEVTAPLPGLKAEDIRIQVLEDMLRIEGAFPTEETEYLLHEIPGGTFRREIRLPAPLQADKIDATMFFANRPDVSPFSAGYRTFVEKLPAMP